MRVRVLAFAGVRELLGAGELQVDVPEKSTAGDVWDALAERNAALTALAPSTRFAHNGRIVASSHAIEEGDELALLPPVGGG